MRSPSPLVLGVAGLGVVFIWSAVHGAQISATVKDLLAGRAPAAPPADPLILGRALPTGATAGEGLDPLRAAHARLNGGTS